VHLTTNIVGIRAFGLAPLVDPAGASEGGKLVNGCPYVAVDI
jgi:hypothetical protein